MYSAQYSNPVIAFHVSQNRIRIYRCTLKDLGLPNYVQLLVNPVAGLLAVKGFQSKPKHQYHKVDYKRLIPKNSLDIHSGYLVKQLKLSCQDIPDVDYYRIEGKSYPDDSVAVFRFADAHISLNEEDEDNAT